MPATTAPRLAPRSAIRSPRLHLPAPFYHGVVRTLILGGTGFIGRHLVDALIAGGHDVTLFHRGLSSGGRSAGVRDVLGDRSDLSALDPDAFDLVIDTSGYEPAPVRAAARRFANVAAYVYISTISVYRDMSATEESAPLKDDAGDDAALSLEKYGSLKVACERVVREERGERALVLRLGRTVGPHDTDDRVPWLLRRVARGGWLVGPGDPEAPAQLLDARDLATFVSRAVAEGVTGTMNVAGEPIPMRALYETIARATGSDARICWVDDELLVKHGVRPYSEQPFWLPKSVRAAPFPTSAARHAGLTLRPVADTIRDTWQWLQTGWEADRAARANRRLEVPAGLDDRRERTILRDAVEVRAYAPDDAPNVSSLVRSVLSEYGFATDVGGLERDLEELETRYKGGRFWIAELGGELVGTIAIRPKDEGRCELKRLYLRADVRGLGLGQRLYEEAEAFARGAGYTKLWLDSSRRFVSAHRLYERNGLVLIEQLDNDWEDNVYEKTLA